MKRKLLSVLLVTVMLLTCIPLGAVSVSAEEYTEGVYTYTVADGEATIIEYSGAGGNVVIPDTLGGYPVVAIADFIFENNSVLHSIVISDSVVEIGAGTFYGCTNLESVIIGDGVTYIGDSTFYGCTALSSLVIGKSVERIEYCAFGNCSSLTEIVLPEGLTTLDFSAFGGCTDLTSLTLPKSITSIGPDAFYGCNALVEVHYAGTNDDWLNVNFSTDGNMSLLNIMWPEAKGLLYDFIDGAITITGFTDDLSEHVVIPSTIACHPVTAIGKAAFSDGLHFVSIVIPEGVETIGGRAFAWTNKLVSVEIPDTVTNIGEYAFLNSGVREVNIPQGITTIRRGTFHSSGISSITIPDSVTTIEGDAFTSSGITSIVIPDSVTSIGSYAFVDCVDLETVTLPKNIETIEAGMFSACAKIKAVTLPENVKTIGTYAFSNCLSLVDIYYSGTGEDRANIVVDTNNESLLSATWHYACINPKDHYSANVQHSVMDTENGNGLAFKFELSASVGVKGKNKVDFTNATMNYLGKTCKLVGMGTVVTNQEEQTLTLDNLNGKTVIDISAVYLADWESDACSFAVRIINIPDYALDRTLYVRPYYIVEVEGEQLVVYGDVNSAAAFEYMA